MKARRKDTLIVFFATLLFLYVAGTILITSWKLWNLSQEANFYNQNVEKTQENKQIWNKIQEERNLIYSSPNFIVRAFSTANKFVQFVVLVAILAITYFLVCIWDCQIKRWQKRRR